MNVYTAEDIAGETFMIAAWPGLNRDNFRGVVIDALSAESIPNPDVNVTSLDLCEWSEENFVAWFTAGGEYKKIIEELQPIEHFFKDAHYETIVWDYPGVWKNEADRHKTMPAELRTHARLSGYGVYSHPDPDDPKNPDWHDRVAGLWDNRDKTL